MTIPAGFRASYEARHIWIPFRILTYGLLLSLVHVNCVASNRVCRKFKSEPEATLPFDQINDTVLEQCPPSSAPFSVYNAHVNGNVSTYKALLICWVKDVRSFALKFDKSVDIGDVGSIQGLRVQTCTNSNDTLIYNRKYSSRNLHYVVVKLIVNDKTHFGFRAYYSERIKGKHSTQHRLIQYKYGSVSEKKKRKKRDAAVTLESTPASQCGVTRNCYRDGPDDCDHFSCKYFVSYNVSTDLFDVEISAKTDGWVAIGFSSDRKMGGDEVIACKKVRSAVECDTYKNPYSHNYPKKKPGPNVVTLKQFQIRDGYLYCHFTRNPSISGYQDLTNEWHQLYAYGPLSSGGDLEKHVDRPQVSDKISTVRRRNEMQKDLKSSSVNVFNSSDMIVVLLSVLTLTSQLIQV